MTKNRQRWRGLWATSGGAGAVPLESKTSDPEGFTVGAANADPQGLADAVRSDRLMDIQSPTPTSVYKYYDARDVLIYVGVTSRGARRQAEHRRCPDAQGVLR